MLTETVQDLQGMARSIRCELLELLSTLGWGHTGGCLSAVDVVTALYFKELHVDPKNPEWEERDRFILSKGHAAPLLYVVLSRKGFFSPSVLPTAHRLGSILQGHPDMTRTPGVDMSTGSLGHGLSIGVGMALAAKLLKKSYRVFVLLGDGELQEGQVWEAAMAASHYALDNLVAIVDHNGLQVDGPCRDVLSIYPLAEKWLSFGWRTQEIDGHDLTEILRAFAEVSDMADKPSVIVANTVKGKGVGCLENKVESHAKVLNQEQLAYALMELRGS